MWWRTERAARKTVKTEGKAEGKGTEEKKSDKERRTRKSIRSRKREKRKGRLNRREGKSKTERTEVIRKWVRKSGMKESVRHMNKLRETRRRMGRGEYKMQQVHYVVLSLPLMTALNGQN